MAVSSPSSVPASTTSRISTSISRSVRSSVEYAYLHGSTSLIDYLDAVRTENELHQLFVDALGAYAKSLITLDFLIGKDVLYAMQ